MGALITSLLAGLASGEAKFAVKGWLRSAVLTSIAGIAALCGIGFLVGAGYIYAARRYGSLEAAIGFGAGFLLLAVVIVVINAAISRLRARRAKKRRTEDVSGLMIAAAASTLPLLLRGKGAAGLMAIPVALAAFLIVRENRRPRPPTRDD